LVLATPQATGKEATVVALTGKIDRHLEQFWNRNNIRPAERAGDAGFLRRVSLDLIGRIPSVREVRAFQASSDPRKRPRKIAELLDRPAHFDHFNIVPRQQWIPQSLDNPQLQRVVSTIGCSLRRSCARRPTNSPADRPAPARRTPATSLA